MGNSETGEVSGDSEVEERRWSSHLQKQFLKHHRWDDELGAYGKSYISYSCSRISLPTATKALVIKYKIIEKSNNQKT